MTGPPKADPETLRLRARPRPVTRFNRRVLIALAGLAAALILGLTLLALEPPELRQGADREGPVEPERKAVAEGLEALPRTYGEAAASVPMLGPPLAGDVGPAVVQMERDLGLAAPGLAAGGSILRPDPEEDLLRAERLRRARQAQQAREADVFFQLSARRGEDVAAASIAPSPSLPSDVGAVPGETTGALPLDRESDPGLQARKLAFVGEGPDSATVNPHPLEEPPSPYAVMAGTVIAASLITGIHSDLPGTVLAQVTENVFDTATGRHLLIPQGARLIGRYDSVVAFGQERALLIWDRIVMPDGSSIVIDNLPATDSAGHAGLADEVDFHTGRLVGGVVLATLLGVGTELTLGEDESELVRALRESAQESTNRAGQEITRRNLEIQPTITIRPGWPLRVIVRKDLILRPYSD